MTSDAAGLENLSSHIARLGGPDGGLCPLHPAAYSFTGVAMSFDRTARTDFLRRVLQELFLSMRYFFAPKATLNYPV